MLLLSFPHLLGRATASFLSGNMQDERDQRIANWTTDELTALARLIRPSGASGKMPKHHDMLDARTMKQRDRLRVKLAQRRAMNNTDSE